MLVLRPSAPNDLEALLRLAELTGPGMTNLPPDREVLNAKLQASAAAFARNIGPGDAPRDEAYLLLLEDTDSGQVVGCGGVFAGVGLDRPFYSYRLLSVPHTSASLGVYRSYRVLQLVNEYEGAAEVGVLFLEPDRRRDGNGRFLSRARFLFVAEFRERFPKQIMAEMRGVQDASGDAVFWQHLGRHFFPLDFGAADRLSARGETQFIADLMPKHPVYACLLPQAAQAVLGVAHPDSRPAMALLEREGFRFEGCVDVFDAGPTLHCPIDTVHTVQASRRSPVVGLAPLEEAPLHMLATPRLDRFRAGRGRLEERDGGVVLQPEVAAALGLAVGDSVRHIAF